MGDPLWLVVALASFDLLLVALDYFPMRAYPRINQAALVATGAEMAGFVVHIFLFFDGAFLILQLATNSGVFGICWLQHLGRLSLEAQEEAGGATDFGIRISHDTATSPPPASRCGRHTDSRA